VAVDAAAVDVVVDASAVVVTDVDASVDEEDASAVVVSSVSGSVS